MSSIVSLPGSAALSSFRIDKIRQEAARLGVALGELTARYWHFLELDAELDAAILQAINLKPARHEFREAPHKILRFMSMTGG